jgi:hypothetical protein
VGPEKDKRSLDEMSRFEIGDSVAGTFNDGKPLEGKIIAVDTVERRILVEYIIGSEDGNTDWYDMETLRNL